MTRTARVLAICVSLLFIVSELSHAGVVKSTGKNGGFDTSASAASVSNLEHNRDLQGKVFDRPMEFMVKISCHSDPSGAGEQASCQRALAACRTSTGIVGAGMLYDIYARPIDRSRGWRYIGSTCFVDGVPGAGQVVTLAMVLNQFHHTPWAKASISTQPVGNVTLVNLKTFYQVNWSAEGYQPEEVDPTIMLGMRVEIRPKLVGFTYVFGDGQTYGPTLSPGGVWPDGNVTHTYPNPGSYGTRVDTTFGGEFRINSGPWTTIPDTVTVPGPVTTITVKTANAVLVN